MKYRLLVLAAALTVAAWPPMISSAEMCPFFPCEAFINECEGLDGTATLTYVAACTGYGGGYSVYPSATSHLRNSTTTPAGNKSVYQNLWVGEGLVPSGIPTPLTWKRRNFAVLEPLG